MPDYTKNQLKNAKEILENASAKQPEGSLKEQAASVTNAIESATDASALDSAEAGVKLQGFDYTKEQAAIQAKLDQAKTEIGNTLHSPDMYNRGTFEPATEASVDRTRGLAGQIGTEPNNPYAPATYSDRARPATQIDLANLDETNVMNVPFLETKSFEVTDIMTVHPVDKSLRFRWANYKNQEGAQYAMLKAMGFENATPEDCVECEVMKSLVKEDGTIKYFDVVLVKINVLLLMARYKRNIMKSMQQVGRWDQGAMREAENTFRNSVSQDLLSAMKRQGIKVEFYSPTMDEVRSQNKTFGGF